MTTEKSTSLRSEKGVALIIVMLLLAVMSALTTALSMSGQTEVAMASNEMFYAGARAAAEAGLNRATEHLNDVNTLNLLAGADNDPNATADNGRVPTIGNGPFTLNNQYTYTLQILDDDDASLYTSALSGGQLAQMQENNDPRVSSNDRLILRATGIGPRNTRVVVQRVLQSVATANVTTTTTTTIANPALLVDGDLNLNGSLEIHGKRGNVHANGNIIGNVSGEITGDITATGTVDDRLDPNGMKAGNMPPIAVPEIRAADYKNLADFILKADGSVINTATNLPCVLCPTGWTYSGGTWSSSGGMPTSATYYVEGPVSMHGTGNHPLTAISVIAEGSITITGNGKFKPENTSKIQFVTNGDFVSNADANDPLDVDGQVMVREQLKLQGGFDFQGRVMVKNKDSASNVYDAVTNPHGRRGANLESANDVNGTVEIEYNGTLDDIVTTQTITTNGPTTYTNNVSGWIEQ
jgi:cytoskeletal protein CcmA (bactofilin family)